MAHCELSGLCRGVVLAAVLWGSAVALAQAEAMETAAEAPQIMIGLDLSKSNPLVTSAAYAARLGERLAHELKDLPLKSRVMVRTFGVYDGGANGLKIDEIVSSRAKPADLAAGLGALVANVPALVREGKLHGQMKTNIVPFLETMSHVIDCQAAPTRVILLTDGAEDSEYGKLTRAGGKLPGPARALYQGCEELLILGLGQGFDSPKATERFRSAWGGWAQGAGFQRFTGLYDW